MSAIDPAVLQAINTEVNAIPFDAIPSPTEGYDVWKDAPDDGSFVCRDYVVRKSELLQEAGIPKLSMTVLLCYTEDNDYHAVLAIDDGEPQPWILDSRFSPIYRMDQPPAAYRWELRQVAGTTNFVPVA